MGLFKKIAKGIKKLGSFTAKVVKGVSQGGILGGIGAGVSNLGSGGKKVSQKAQDAVFASGIVVTTQDDQKKKMLMFGGIGLAIMAVVYFIFKRK
jgi:hypothetical protein